MENKSFESSMAQVNGKGGNSPFQRGGRPPFNRGNNFNRRGRGNSRNFSRGGRGNYSNFNRGSGRGDNRSFGRGNGPSFNRGNRRPFNRGGRPFNRGGNRFSDQQNSDERGNDQQNFKRNFSNRGGFKNSTESPDFSPKFTKGWDDNEEHDQTKSQSKHLKFDESLEMQTDNAEGENQQQTSHFVKGNVKTTENKDETDSSENDKEDVSEAENKIQQNISNTGEVDTSESEEEIEMNASKDVSNLSELNDTMKNENVNREIGKENDLNLTDANVRKDLYNRSISVNNLHPAIKEKQLEEFFSKYGKIEKITAGIFKPASKNTKISGYGVIVFEKHEDALKALEVNGMEYKGYHICVGKRAQYFCNPNLTVCVSNLAPELDKDVLWSHFQNCGVISYIRISASSKDLEKNYAYVEFESADSIKLAVSMNNSKIANRIISVAPFSSNFAKQKHMNERSPHGSKVQVQKNKSKDGSFTVTVNKKMPRKLGSPNKSRRGKSVKSGFIQKKKKQ